MTVRIALLADTHLGFDLPVRPRVKRRRRGPDFFANFERVLSEALSEEVDCIVHGGDLFYRSQVPAQLVQKVFLSFKRVADAGIPLFIVPGNHERSRIPYQMLALHSGIHIFDRPRTFVVGCKGGRLAFAGFPFCRRGARSQFRTLLDATGWSEQDADVRILCLHQCFEGATVGAHNYTFGSGEDVIRISDVPGEFAAVLAGHIHRAQVLNRHSCVIYPGSIERTSFAERDETKGYMLVTLRVSLNSYADVSWRFRELPARPMVVEELSVEGMNRSELEAALDRLLRRLPDHAVAQIRAKGVPDDHARSVLSAASLRARAPDTVNVECVMLDVRNLHGTELCS